jgi:hypothetical protein
MVNLKVIKVALIIFFVITYGHCLAQNDKNFLIKKILVNTRSNAYSQVKIKAFDAFTKEPLLSIIRIDGVSFSQCDTSLSTFYLSSSKHVLQVGWLGYVYSDKVKLKTKLSEDYEISFYLKPDTKPLH